jgi:PAS domain S-box-containing protein
MKPERSATQPSDGPTSTLQAQERTASWVTGLSLLFLLLSLLALVLVPAYLEREVAQVRARLRDVLEPAGSLATRIEFAHARQMEASQAFLLSGDARFRIRFREAVRDEDEALQALQPLAEGMSLEVRERHANLVALSFSWRLRHEDMLRQEALPGELHPAFPSRELLESLTSDRAIYEEVLAASGSLREALALEVRRGEDAMARARSLQTRISRVLAFLGLVATVVVIFLGLRLRQLMAESEARRQDALRARREADALLGSTGDGVIGMDREGRCTFLNRAGAEILGYPTRLVVGRDVHDLLHHSHEDGRPYPRESCPILQALDSGESISGRNEILWRAGRQPFPVRISVRALKDGAELKGAVLSFTDMTETRAAERSLRQAVQTRDEVLAVVSHDLRNPVGTIYSAASLLLDMELPAEKRREHLTTVKRSATRMNRLIQDLLDVARLEAGALSVDAGWFQVGGLVQEAVECHRVQAEVDGVRLLACVPEGVGEAWGDRDRLLQVLTNLMENALRFTPAGGVVEAAVRVDEPTGELHVSVSDSGPGISPEDQDRLFDRFWQVSRKDKRGAGLGLSIAKGIVEAHGGRIWVESREGSGSTFWFSIPRTRQPRS